MRCRRRLVALGPQLRSARGRTWRTPAPSPRWSNAWPPPGTGARCGRCWISIAGSSPSSRWRSPWTWRTTRGCWNGSTTCTGRTIPTRSTSCGAWVDAQNLLWAYRYRLYARLSPEEILNYTLQRNLRVNADVVRAIALGAPLLEVVRSIWHGRLAGLDALADLPEQEALPRLELLFQRHFYALAQRTRALAAHCGWRRSCPTSSCWNTRFAIWWRLSRANRSGGRAHGSGPTSSESGVCDVHTGAHERGQLLHLRRGHPTGRAGASHAWAPCSSKMGAARRMARTRIAGRPWPGTTPTRNGVCAQLVEALGSPAAAGALPADLDLEHDLFAIGAFLDEVGPAVDDWRRNAGGDRAGAGAVALPDRADAPARAAGRAGGTADGPAEPAPGRRHHAGGEPGAHPDGAVPHPLRHHPDLHLCRGARWCLPPRPRSMRRSSTARCAAPSSNPSRCLPT